MPRETPFEAISKTLQACFDSVSESSVRISSPKETATRLTFVFRERIENEIDQESEISVGACASMVVYILSEYVLDLDEWSNEKCGLAISLGNTLTAMKEASFFDEFSNEDRIRFKKAERIFRDYEGNLLKVRPDLYEVCFWIPEHVERRARQRMSVPTNVLDPITQPPELD